MPHEFDLPTVPPSVAAPSFEMPEAKPEPLPRLYVAWVVFFAIFGLLIYGSLGGQKSEKIDTSAATTWKQKEQAIELKLGLFSLSSKSGGKMRKAAFRDEIEDLFVEAKSNHAAQRLRIVLRLEDGEQPFGDDLKNLAKSPLASDKAFGELSAQKKLDSKVATGLLARLNEKGLAEKLLRVRVLESMGDKSVRQKLFPPEKAMRMTLLMFAILVSLFLGFAAWLTYYFMRRDGRWLPKGMVFQDIDKGRADRLILAASIVIGSFVLGSELARAAYSTVGKLAIFTPAITVAFAIFAIFSVPIAGYRIRPKSMGLTTHKIGEEIAWGVGATIANIPLVILASLLMMSLKDYLPGGGHPISDELLKGQDAAGLAKILFFAAIVAPIWEEIVFRGLIFPGLAKVTSGPLVGAIVSSLLFAAIHPQGALGVIPLGTIAMMLCGVGYQRRSIVSGMVFHSLNNAGALLVALLLSSAMK